MSVVLWVWRRPGTEQRRVVLRACKNVLCGAANKFKAVGVAMTPSKKMVQRVTAGGNPIVTAVLRGSVPKHPNVKRMLKSDKF